MRVGLAALTLLCSGQEVRLLPVAWPGSDPRESGDEDQAGGQQGGAHDGAGVGCRERHTMWCDTLLAGSNDNLGPTCKDDMSRRPVSLFSLTHRLT